MSALKDELMSDEPYRYEHDQVMGDYVFRKGDRVLFRASSLAVCYSEDTHMFGIPGEPIYTLLKHGNSEYVLEHARKLQTAYRDAGLPGMASEVMVILRRLLGGRNSKQDHFNLWLPWPLHSRTIHPHSERT